MTDAELVSAIISLNENRIVGKTRLQKTMYLLDECGLSSGFNFEYYNFGPYSFELTDAANYATAAKLVRVRTKRGYHEIPYSVFESKAEIPKKIRSLKAEKIKGLLQKMEGRSAVVLELAATLKFLTNEGLSADEAVHQLKMLKPQKASEARIQEANELLSEIGL